MEHSVTARYTWTADELMQGVRYHRRRGQGRRQRWIAWWITGVAGSGIILAIWTDTLGSSALLFVLLAAGLAGILLPDWLTRRQMAASAAQGRPITIALSENGMESNITSVSQNQWTWAALSEAVQTPEGLLVYLNKASFVWLPEHAFSSPAEARRAYDMASAHAPKFSRVK